MKSILLFVVLLCVTAAADAQMPKDGRYIYKIAFSMHGGISSNTCIVIVKGDSVKVIADEHSNLSLSRKGDIIDEGIIMKHKSGVWIIGTNLKDKLLDEVGGCTDGPQVIDFKKKIFWIC